MDKDAPLDGAPAQRGQDLVDEGPLAVGPEPLEPNDAPQAGRQSEEENVGKSERNDFGWMIFEEHAEEIVAASAVHAGGHVGRHRVRDTVNFVRCHLLFFTIIYLLICFYLLIGHHRSWE